MKKTILKVAGIVFMVSALVLTQIPVLGTKAASKAYDGFMLDGSKLVKYTGTADAVSVPRGVTIIGSEAFVDNDILTTISFPAELEVIENGAFSSCSNLKRVELPEGVETIGNGAFADCDALEVVSLPASLLDLGTSAFAGCDKLQSVYISPRNNYFSVDDGAIYNKKQTVLYQMLAGREADLYKMPNSVEEIKKYAFWGCSNLQDVNVSSNLKEIGDFAFSNATGLREIVLPYSVRAIRRKGFEDCSNLTDITIPVSATQIDPTAFDGCYNVRIHAEPGSIAEAYALELEESRAANEEYEDSLSQNAINSHWKAEADETDPVTKKKRANYASDVEHYVEWDINSPGVLGRTKVVSGQAVVLMNSDFDVNGGSNQDLISDGYLADELLKAAIVGDSIGYKAFYGDSSLSYVSLPNSIYRIGSFAFARSGLKEITIPPGVDTIENAAFYHCDQLEKVYIPASVKEIGSDAFSNSLWLNKWYNGSDVDPFLIVGDGILLAYKGNSSNVSIPSTVRSIGPGVFQNHNEIISVSIPDSVTRIDEDAFFGCASLMTVSGMNSVSKIKDRAFYGCPLETVRIPASVKELGIASYGGNPLINSVIFLGDNIPQLSFEESSMRLSSNRAPVFDGIDAIVVNNGVTKNKLDNTVLDPNCSDYSGVIYNISSGYENKVAIPFLSYMPEEETNLPSEIYVYGLAYKVNAVKPDYSEVKPGVSDNSLQNLMVVDHDKLKKNDVTVSSSGNAFDFSDYRFYVSNPGEGSKDLTNAIANYYEEPNDKNSFFMDLSLYDQKDLIPIHNLGKSTLDITIPVPTDLIGKEICAVTLDKNGKPEVLFCTLSVKDKRQYATFTISHLSPYALFAPDGELKDRIVQKKSNASGMEGLDDTPDTGDFLNVKMILCIGLLALGLFMFLLGFKGKNKA